jgi:putative hydrolase
MEWVVRASVNAAVRNGPVVLAHPFRLLAELGIDARNVHPAYVRWLADALVEQQACIEISERWRCPSPRIIRCFLMAGVPVRASTGSNSPETVGRYSWCREIAGELEGCGPGREPVEPFSLLSASLR